MNLGMVVFNVIILKVSLQVMILLDVQVVEVWRDDFMNVGVDWVVLVLGLFYELLGEVYGVLDFDKYVFFFGFGFEEGMINLFIEIGLIINLL